MKTLISNTGFGKLLKSKQREFGANVGYLEWYEETRNKIDEFLSQPLNISMFIPCKLVDGKWIVFEYPILPKKFSHNYTEAKFDALVKEYKESQSRVLFEGFELINEDKTYIYLKSKDIKIIYEKSDRLFIIETSDEFTQYASTIEDLVKYNLTLTPTAIK